MVAKASLKSLRFDPRVEVSDREIEQWKAAQQAWVSIRQSGTRVWGHWMTVGDALLSGRRYAQRAANAEAGAIYARAFSDWLVHYRLDTIPKADRAALLQIMENRAAVENWRATLPEGDRSLYNHPRTVLRKFLAETKPKTERTPKPPRERDPDTAEEINAEVERVQRARRHLAQVEAMLRERGGEPPPRPDGLEEFDDPAQWPVESKGEGRAPARRVSRAPGQPESVPVMIMDVHAPPEGDIATPLSGCALRLMLAATHALSTPPRHVGEFDWAWQTLGGANIMTVRLNKDGYVSDIRLYAELDPEGDLMERINEWDGSVWQEKAS